jgi:hypothetical protein
MFVFFAGSRGALLCANALRHPVYSNPVVVPFVWRCGILIIFCLFRRCAFIKSKSCWFRSLKSQSPYNYLIYSTNSYKFTFSFQLVTKHGDRLLVQKPLKIDRGFRGILQVARWEVNQCFSRCSWNACLSHIFMCVQHFSEIGHKGGASSRVAAAPPW